MKKLTGIKGFSLAEIVVTLLIIGVVAALTMPSLVEDVNRKEHATRLKSVNSALNQAVSKMEIDNGPVGKNQYWTDITQFWPLFTEQFNTFKICGPGEKGCFTEGMIKGLDGKDWSVYDGGGYTMRTTDGIAYNFYANEGSTKCTKASQGVSAEDEKNAFGRFLIDVNGEKGPNKFGEDVYFFCIIKDKGIVPAGFDSNKDCVRDGKSLGVSCAGKVIREGKIDY